MKYKNYKNSYTKEDKIYSRENMLDMSLREMITRKDELLAQTKVLGIPEEEELRNSENAVYVEAYTRDDGTEVKAHWRSKPNCGQIITNIDNKNSSEALESKKYVETEKYRKEFMEQEKQKSIERKDPEEIAGVKKGKPKTFFEMMKQGVNPKYMSENDDESKFSLNCQSCNVACELVIRGYDVEANSYDNHYAHELAKNNQSAYIDPITNKECVMNKIDIDKVDCYEYLESVVHINERYEFSYNITPVDGSYSDTKSHSVFMTRMEDGNLLIYDGQDGEIAYGKQQVRSYIYSKINDYNTLFNPKILRVDNKKVNPYYTNKVVVARDKYLK